MNILLNISPSTITFIVIVVIFSIIEVIVIISSLKKCPENHLMVIFKKLDNGTGKSYKLFQGNKTFVFPIIQYYHLLDLRPIKIPINVANAIDKNNNRINLSLTFTVKISTETNIVDNAVDRLIELSVSDIKTMINDVVLGEMRIYISNIDEEDMKNNYDKTFKDLQEQITPNLNKLGIQIDDIQLGDKTEVIR